MGLLGCLVPGCKSAGLRRDTSTSPVSNSDALAEEYGLVHPSVFQRQGPVLTSSGKYSRVELPPYQLTGPLEWGACRDRRALRFASGSLPDDSTCRDARGSRRTAHRRGAQLAQSTGAGAGSVPAAHAAAQRRGEARPPGGAGLQVATRFWLARKSMVCAVSHATALPPAAALRGRPSACIGAAQMSEPCLARLQIAHKPPLRAPLLPECTTAYVDSALNDGKLHLRCPGAAGSGLCRELDMNHVKVFASPGVLGERVEQLRRQHGARLSDSLKDPSFAAFSPSTRGNVPVPRRHRPSGCDHMVCKCGHVWNWKDKEAVVAN